MAKVDFPDGVIVDSISLGLSYPNQSVLTSVFTGSQQVINRNTGFWTGSISIFPIENVNQEGRDLANAMELFIHRLKGQENYFEIDISNERFGNYRKLPSVINNLGETQNNRGQGTNSLVSRRSPTQAETDSIVGSYLQYKSRLRQVASVGTVIHRAQRQSPDWETPITLIPSHNTFEDSTRDYSLVPLLRATYSGNEAIQTQRDGHFVGGWVINFKEWIE